MGEDMLTVGTLPVGIPLEDTHRRDIQLEEDSHEGSHGEDILVEDMVEEGKLHEVERNVLLQQHMWQDERRALCPVRPDYYDCYFHLPSFFNLKQNHRDCDKWINRIMQHEVVSKKLMLLYCFMGYGISCLTHMECIYRN